MEGFAIFADISAGRALLVPVQLAMVEVLGLRFARHAVWNRPQDPLHHGQVFPVIVCLEQGDAQVQLEHDTPNGPHVAWLRPPKLCNREIINGLKHKWHRTNYSVSVPS